jgi:hypothetical protein
MKLRFQFVKEEWQWNGLVLFSLLFVLGLVYSFTESPLLTKSAAVILTVMWSWSWIKELRCRRLYPKDYAYYIYAEWGPVGRLPRLPRLQQKLPSIDTMTLREWIKEFNHLDNYIGRIALAGGSPIVGEEEIVRLLRTKYPFLEKMGLEKARFLVGYYALHDGYDKSPRIKVDEI